MILELIGLVRDHEIPILELRVINVNFLPPDFHYVHQEAVMKARISGQGQDSLSRVAGLLSVPGEQRERERSVVGIFLSRLFRGHYSRETCAAKITRWILS